MNDDSRLVRPTPSLGVLTALRARRLELALLTATTLTALVVLRLVGTQIFTEPWTVDPWFYTALMTNFDFAYEWFGTTYYASRLPLILPGLFLNSFLTPVQAYVVLHLVLYLAGGAFLYLLVRSLFGIRVALLVYPAFLTNAIYVDSHTWDYFDGAVVTYLSGGLYLLVSSIGSASRVRPALAGFFLAAAATTNLFATLLVLGAVVAHLASRVAFDRRLGVRRIAIDAGLFSFGAAVLLAACGVFAETHGGRLLFFMWQIEALGNLSTAAFKLPTYDWIPNEPRLLVPPFVVLATLIAWRRPGDTGRPGVGLAVSAAGFAIFLVLVVWELAWSGTFLQLAYYFSTLYPFLFVGLAATVFLLGRAAPGAGLPPAVLPLLGLIAGAAPLVAIYGLDRVDLSGRQGAKIALGLMCITVAAAAILRFVRDRRFSAVAAPLAAALAIASVNYASAANTTTHVNFETRNSPLAEGDEIFRIGSQLVDFMRSRELQYSLPAFWFDQSSDTSLTGPQSLYYYSATYLNLDMPQIDDEFRSRIESTRPEHVVLLCSEPACRGGPEAMRRAGYWVRPVAARRLRSGSKSVWVRAYALQTQP